ncbi:PQQ-binding-like beta-propeller repeat protein [Marinobacter gelidimuriae]|uniref:PQQ-binding-like beta-propeller repeat protein n=1 Tax=Marinobacter gelidimuriae TaxID=2739064 RepID=UPI00037FA65F|nr:YncE family protein [Marinobacter gelidimuriae]
MITLCNGARTLLVVWVLLLSASLSADPKVIPANTLYTPVFGANQAVFLNADGPYTLPVGQRTHDVVLGPNLDLLYSAQMKPMDDNALEVISLSSGEVVARIPMGKMAMHLEFGPDNRTLYVAAGKQIALVDTAERKVLRRYPAEQAVAVSVGANNAFLSDFAGQQIAVINTGNHELEAPIKLDRRPLHSALSPDGQYIYVAALGSNWFSHYILRDNGLVVVDLKTREEAAFVPMGIDAVDVAVAPNGRVYATNTENDRVVAIQPGTWETLWTSSVPQARSIAVNPVDGGVYIAVKGQNRIHVLDPEDGSERKVFEVPGEAQRLRFTPRRVDIP